MTLSKEHQAALKALKQAAKENAQLPWEAF